MKYHLLGLLLFATLLPVSFAEDAKAPKDGADLSRFKTADALWDHIKSMQEGPSETPTSREDAVRILKQYFADVQAATDEFIKRFPEDPRRWDAKLAQLHLKEGLAQMNRQPTDPAETEAVLKGIIEAKDATATTKLDAKVALIETHLQAIEDPSDAKAIAGVVEEIVAFTTENPSDERTDPLQLLRVELIQETDPAGAEEILRELAKSNNAEIREAAERQLFVKNLHKKPVELSFTALDGTTVDLSKYRGKVVLLDFWATWCGPCVQEIPNLVSTYEKLNGKGFEIIGISLDRDKDKLLAMTKERGMTWPQHFDGKGWKNEISTRFGITSIPAQWLLDKKGMVRETNARHDLAGQVEKLLAE